MLKFKDFNGLLTEVIKLWMEIISPIKQFINRGLIKPDRQQVNPNEGSLNFLSYGFRIKELNFD